MILNEEKLRPLVRQALQEAIKNPQGTARGLGLEYLYALLQPAMIDVANLDLQKIHLPHHQAREEIVLDDEEELKDHGSEIDKPEKSSDIDTYMVDINPQDFSDELSLLKK